MQKGDVVLVDYTGTDLTTNRVFDSTMADAAQKAGIFDSRITYKPVPIVLGKHEMLNSLEDEMEKMSVGETKKIVLPAVRGFGDRLAENIRLTSLKDFREHKMNPYPGLLVEVNGVQGRVQSVSGGRVRIDFNHPLAGKELEYEIVIRKKFDTLVEQASALFDKFFPFVEEKDKKISEKAGVIEIELPESASKIKEIEVFKQVFAKVLAEQLVGVKQVLFVDKNQSKQAVADDSKTEKKEAVAGKSAPVSVPKKAAKTV